MVAHSMPSAGPHTACCALPRRYSAGSARGRTRKGAALPLSGHMRPRGTRGLFALFVLVALPVALRHHLVGNALGKAQLDQGLDLVGHHLVSRRLDGGDDVLDADRPPSLGPPVNVPALLAAPNLGRASWRPRRSGRRPARPAGSPAEAGGRGSLSRSAAAPGRTSPRP